MAQRIFLIVCFIFAQTIHAQSVIPSYQPEDEYLYTEIASNVPSNQKAELQKTPYREVSGPYSHKWRWFERWFKSDIPSSCQPIMLSEGQTSLKLSFHAVRIIGDINVRLSTKNTPSTVNIHAAPQDLAKVKMCVTPSGLLNIVYHKGTHIVGPVNMDIQTHYLTGFSYYGKGTVEGANIVANLERFVINNKGTTRLSGVIHVCDIHASGRGFIQLGGVVGEHLHVTLSKHAKLKLTGVIGLRRLDMSDNTWFSLAWVQAPTLIVRLSGKAYVQLAGAVNKLDVEASNFAQFNGRYLRARRTFVKTFNNSIARISTTEHQHTLASDASDIRFYSLPDMKADFMAFDGAVLDMRKFNTAFVKQITPYNE